MTSPKRFAIKPTSTNGTSCFWAQTDGEKHLAGRVELVGDQAVVRYPDTEAPGGYRIFIGDEKEPGMAFAVQLDAAESDLRQADRQDVEALATQSSGAADAEKPAVVAPQWKVKWEFWTLFIWLAAAAALTEATLAHAFSRAR